MKRVHKKSQRTSFVIRRIGMGILAYYISMAVICIIADKQLTATVYGEIYERLTWACMGAHFKSAEESALFKKEFVADLEHYFMLDRSAGFRICLNIRRVMTLNLGKSRFVMTNWPIRSRLVRDIIIQATPPTLILFFSTTIFSALIGIYIGAKSAAFPGKRLDHFIANNTMLFSGTPSWWVGLVFVMVFVMHIPVFRMGALHSTPIPENWFMRIIDYIYYLLPPLIAVALTKIWAFAFYTRNIIIAPLQEDYVFAARGHGLPERKVRRIALRCASPAIVTTVSLSLVQAITGDILIEKVLSRPGLGSTLVTAIQRNDFALMLGIISIIVALYCITLTLLDIIYLSLDPRIQVA